MKQAVKYIVLSIASMVCMLMVLFITGFFVGTAPGVPSGYLFLPIMSYLALFAAMVLFTVWSFRFSDGKPHQKSLILAVCMLALALLLFGVQKLFTM